MREEIGRKTRSFPHLFCCICSFGGFAAKEGMLCVMDDVGMWGRGTITGIWKSETRECDCILSATHPSHFLSFLLSFAPPTPRIDHIISNNHGFRWNIFGRARMLILAWAAAACAMMMMMCQTTAATAAIIITVSPTNPGGIAAAVARANAGNTVQVAAGRYEGVDSCGIV